MGEAGSNPILTWCLFKLFLKAFGKIRLIIESNLIGNLRNGINLFLYEQGCFAQTKVLHELTRSQAGDGFQRANHAENKDLESCYLRLLTSESPTHSAPSQIFS